MKFKKVTREEFWSFINNSKEDIISKTTGDCPYTSIFKYRYGGIVGKKVNKYAIVNGKIHKGLIEATYYFREGGEK